MNLVTRTRALWLATICAIAQAQPSEPFILERDAAHTTAFGDQFYGGLTAGDGEYFAVWVDLRTGGLAPAGYDLYAQRIRPDGSLVHPGSLELLRDPDRMATFVPAAGWNGTNYLVAWFEGSRLYGLRVSTGGEVLDPGGFLIDTIPGARQWPAIASDGDNFLVIYADDSTSKRVLAKRISNGGEVLDGAPITIASGLTGVGFPKGTFAAGTYVVTWTQAPNQAIYASRVMPDGEVVDPGGINVSGGGVDVDPHVDYDGENFFIVWQRRDGNFWDLWGEHLSPQGEVLAPAEQLLDGNLFGDVSSGQVAWNGQEHLVTITTGEPIFSNSDAYALRVSPEGSAIGDPFPVNTTAGESSVVLGVSAVGDQFFMLWEGNYVSGVSFVYDTQGARVASGGDVLDFPEPIDVSTCAAWQIASSVSFDGANFLCVFEDWREGKPTYQPDLFAVRVSPDGQPLEPSAFRLADGTSRPQTHPDSAFGGGVHAVVYEQRDGAVTQVRMVRVAPDGEVINPGGSLIFANEPTGETFRPKVAFNGETFFVVWYDSLLHQGQESLQFALVSPDGTIVHGPANIPNSRGSSLNAFDVGSDGVDFLVGWVDSGLVKASRFDGAGQHQRTSVLEDAGNWITELPRVAFNGRDYLIAWEQFSDTGPRINGHLVAADASPIGDTFAIAGPADFIAPLAAFGLGGEFVVIGTQRGAAPEGMFSARIDGGGGVGPLEPLLPRPEERSYSGSSFAMTPGGLMLAVHSLWEGNPYNTPRAQGQFFAFGSCEADLDGDGDADADDFFAYLDAFAAGDTDTCDRDGDADCDADDFFAYLDLFAAGC